MDGKVNGLRSAMEGTSRTRFSESMGETQDTQHMVSSGRSLESIEPSRQEVGRCWERVRSVPDLQSPGARRQHAGAGWRGQLQTPSVLRVTNDIG